VPQLPNVGRKHSLKPASGGELMEFGKSEKLLIEYNE